MRFTKAMLLVVVLFALVSGPALWAQANGTVQGKITDPSGAPLPGAQVTVTGPGGSRTVSADKTGFFQISDLPPGRYRVRAALDTLATSAPRATGPRPRQ